MHSNCEHSSSSRLASTTLGTATLFMFFISIAAVACTKDQPQEVNKAEEVILIKKPMPKPSIPVDPEIKERTAAQAEPQRNTKSKHGYYTVQKGDSLSKIAGHKDVYDDPMKWTSLFRRNMDKFNGMEITADFQNKELPKGLDLNFLTVSQVVENLQKLGQEVYTVNVLSSETQKKIVPRAITLMKNGYNAYICRAMVKGKKWLRLRAGFFDSYSKAVAAGDHIMSILEGTNVWIAKIDKSELEEFGGY